MARLVVLGGLGAVGVMVILFLLIQLVPFGKDHSNPPVLQEPAWSDAQTRQLVVRACYECHSNETAWPWYSNIAPVSWLVQRDVNVGRRKLNFSEWGRPRNEADHAAQIVNEGEMPPWFFVIAHPEAKLSQDDKTLLVQGLRATFGNGEGRVRAQSR